MNVKGQTRLNEYKHIADELLQRDLSKAAFEKVKCVGYYFVAKEPGKGDGGDYYGNESKAFSDGQYMLILYTLFSEKLDYIFKFHVVIDSDHVAALPTAELKTIPTCVKQNRKCHFISKQAAFEIAINDSIQYPTNLTIELKIPLKSNVPYWMVSGQDKSNVDYSRQEPEDGYKFFPLRRENTRYVNAITGKLLSYEEYQILDDNSEY